MKDLLSFLETKAIEAQPTQGERMYQMLTTRGKEGPRKVFTVEPKGDKKIVRKPVPQVPTKYIYCQGSHFLFKCIKFLKETAKN